MRNYSMRSLQLNGVNLQRWISPALLSSLACFLFMAFAATGLATVYYISPSGSDGNDGLTEKTALATFVRSYSFLEPGDTLLLLDGTYRQQLNPQVSGEQNAPITFKAMHLGKAIIEMASDGNAVLVYSTNRSNRRYLVLDGLIARGHGEFSAIRLASSDRITEEQMTNNITVRNCGAFGSASMKNKVVFDVGNNVRDSLIEDVWAYGFGRKALQVFGSMRITVRRAVVRYDYWDGSGYKPNDPRDDFSGYNTRDSIFENIIALDSAPTPPNRKADRSSFVVAGNETPALVSGSSFNKYLGLLALGGEGSGLAVDGGSGSPNQGMVFENIIIWDKQWYGFNIQGNDKGSKIRYITTGGSRELTGLRVDAYPHHPITDTSVTNCFSTKNKGRGYYYGEAGLKVFQDNTATHNGRGHDLEPSYAPQLKYLVRPAMVKGHERGGTMLYRYVDGELTDTPLWPWPNEELIRQQMCNTDDLQAVGRIAANGSGWEPAWCASGKSLTRYVWEYLGNKIPDTLYP